MASSREPRITGLGAITSIGHTAAAAASAFRAGIVRARPLAFVDVDGGPITGRPVAGFSDGFAQFGRWLRLALGALEDLRTGQEWPGGTEATRRTAVIVCLPHLEPDRFGLPTEDLPGLLRSACFDPLLELSGPLATPANCRAVFGHCGPAEAVSIAHELLARDPQLHRVLLLAADSTCDAQSLAWLAGQGRLKNDDNPVGLIPGEAGAAVLLERPEVATARGATSLASVSRPALGAPLGASAAAADLGRGIAGTLVEAFAAAGVASPREVYLDLNGEVWRSEAWGHALVHLQRRPGLRDLLAVLPGAGLGELGAAGALLSIVFAARAFVRGHALAPHAAVVSLDERRACSAFVVGRP